MVFALEYPCVTPIGHIA